MRKLIYLWVMLLLPYIAYAATYEETFQTSVSVAIDTGINIINISIEGQTNIYSISNSTNIYTINIKRNVTCSNSSSQYVSNYYNYCNNGNNLTTLDRLTTTCKNIADAYGDASAYYKPLLECTTLKSQCEKDRDVYKVGYDKVISLEGNYNNCITEKTNVQSQLTTCSTEISQVRIEKTNQETQLKDIQSSSGMFKFGFFILLIGVIIFVATKYKKKESKHPLDSSMPPQT